MLASPITQASILVFIFLAFFTPTASFQYDTSAIQEWCSYIFRHGIGQVYNCAGREFNYPPLICYPLYMFGKFQGSVDSIARYFYFFKLFSLLFDIAGAYIIAYLVSGHSRRVTVFLFLVLNPIFIYNSYCWGQVDSVFSVMVFSSFILMMRRKLVWSLVLYLLALNFKAQAIIFFPLLGLQYLYIFWGSFNIKNIATALFAMAVVELAILFPFILAGEVPHLWKVVSSLGNYYPQTVISACNFWMIVFGSRGIAINDSTVYLGLSYKNWGLILFCLSSFFTLLPIFVAVASRFLGKVQFVVSMEMMFVTAALITLNFFFFNTEMHERYSHPALIFISAYAFCQKRYLILSIVFLAYFANMEQCVHFFNFSNYNVVFFNTKCVSWLFAGSIILLTFRLYQQFYLNKENFHER